MRRHPLQVLGVKLHSFEASRIGVTVGVSERRYIGIPTKKNFHTVRWTSTLTDPIVFPLLSGRSLRLSVCSSVSGCRPLFRPSVVRLSRAQFSIANESKGDRCPSILGMHGGPGIWGRKGISCLYTPRALLFFLPMLLEIIDYFYRSDPGQSQLCVCGARISFPKMAPYGSKK